MAYGGRAEGKSGISKGSLFRPQRMVCVGRTVSLQGARGVKKCTIKISGIQRTGMISLDDRRSVSQSRWFGRRVCHIVMIE